MASLYTRRPLLDLEGVPSLLRFDWAEDLDEVERGGRAVLTQCKKVSNIGQANSLADLLLGLAPKWLWTPEKDREALGFRLVCSDLRFAGRGPIPLDSYRPMPGDSYRDAVLARALAQLETPPGPHSDRACWQLEAEAFGFKRLCREVWERTEVLYLESDPLLDDPAGPLFRAEREALALLVRMLMVDPARQRQAITALRALLHTNLVEFNPLSALPSPWIDREPRVVEYDDVHYTLFEFQAPPEEPIPFQVVTRPFLEEAAAEPKRLFVARRPRWADVVHGEDEEIRFVEREMTDRLVARVRNELLGSLGAEEPLPVLFVLGAPGAGKSTLVLRVAACLVKAGFAVVAAPKLNLDCIEEEEVEPFLRALARLAEGPLPVLLVLDDPLFAESGWDGLLRRLAKWSRRVAVLGASPEFLFRQFGYTLTAGRQIATDSLFLPRPLQAERRVLAQLHGRDVESFEQREEDFLVLAMEASAGISFGTIIDRIWITLNLGCPIDPSLGPAELSWPVRAYLVACCFHRLYLRCSEVLMLAVLRHTGRDQPPDGLTHELRRLVNEQGWSIFSIEPLTNWQRYLGSQIGAAHARIASEAWRQRPVPAFDVSDWILACSVDAQPAAEEIGRLGARIEQEFGSSNEGSFLSRLTALWNRAADDGKIEARDLYLLQSALLAENKLSAVRRLRPALAACVARHDEQSWLAFMALARDYGSVDAVTESLGPNFDLLSSLQVAQLHLAPFRASQFLDMIRGEPVYESAFTDRILKSSKHAQAYKLLSKLLKENAEDAAFRMAAIEWVQENPAHPEAHWLLKLLVKVHPTDDIIYRHILEWVELYPANSQAYLLLKPIVRANSGNRIIQAGVLAWIRDSANPLGYRFLENFVRTFPEDQELWQAVLGFVRDSPNQPYMVKLLERLVEANLRDEAFRRYLSRWLQDNPRHPHAYWLLARLGEANADGEAGLQGLLDWIKENPDHRKVHKLLKPFELGEGAELFRERLLKWIRDNPGYAQAPELLQRLVADPAAVPFRAHVFDWLRDNMSRPSAHHLLAALIKASKGEEKIHDYALEQITKQPDHPMVPVLLSALAACCNNSKDIFRLGEDHILNPNRPGRTTVLAALLRSSKAAPKYIDLAIDCLQQFGDKGRKFILWSLAVTFAQNIGTALAYVASCQSPYRRNVVLKGIAAGLKKYPGGIESLLGGIATLHADDANELIVQLFDYGHASEDFAAFVAKRLAQNFRRRGYGFLCRAAKRNPAARSALLASSNLDSRVRADLSGA